MKPFVILVMFLSLMCTPLGAEERPAPDVIIKGGMLYDGTGGKPVKADVAIKDDRIVAVGNLRDASAKTVINAHGLAVAPGFINMLSWSTVSLLIDGRSQGEIRQGVTTEVFGEGESMGPLNEEMKRRLSANQGDLKFEIAWTTLAEYLAYLEKRGVSPNVASFIGAGTIRRHVLGLENKKPTSAQLEQMCELVRREMESGALGIGSSLIYAPDAYASTEELIAMCKVAAKYRGMYISHMRSEGSGLIEAVEELLRISREAGLPAEIYHWKATGLNKREQIDRVTAMVNSARRAGRRITADVYLYSASSNRLSSRIPLWAHDGGDEALLERLRDPATRRKISAEMHQRGQTSKTLLIGFKSEDLRPLVGKTLEEAARLRGKDQVETLLDLVLEDNAAPRVVAFVMDEENIARELKQPWVSLGSDATSMAPEGVFAKSATHPRAYGNFAKLFRKYVREDKVISLQEAVRRVTGLPASNLGLDRRGFIREGFFADVVVFNPNTITDTATYENPHQYAVGMQHVFVNGVQVLKEGEHTGAKPGRALWGPGKVK
jgi:N-acyl-D-amino-acid deacylase